MLELVVRPTTVVACLADATGVDAAVAAWRGHALRVAPDEAMLLADPSAGDDPAADRSSALVRAEAVALAADHDAIVLDATDGWCVWRLAGEDAPEAFARLSRIRPPAAFAQGDVADVPARIVVGSDGIDVLVPAMYRDAVRERILAECDDLRIRERSAGPGANA